MKERLTGAIILVALIVLLVPELLTGPVRSAPRSAAAEPSAEGAPLRSYTINLSDDAHARGAALPASGPEQPAPVGGSSMPANAPADAPPATPASAPAPRAVPAAQPPSAGTPVPQPAGAARSAPGSAAIVRPAQSHAAPPLQAGATPTPAASGSGAWVVQLGSFASRANAERLAHQVRTRGFQVSVSQAASGRRLFRVRVGPVHDRAAAGELAGKLRAAGHSGSVVPR